MGLLVRILERKGFKNLQKETAASGNFPKIYHQKYKQENSRKFGVAAFLL